MKTCLFSFLFVIVAISVGICYAYPAPAVVQGENDWTLDLLFAQPSQITIKNAEGKSERFWYIILTLVNPSSTDVPFYPSCDLVTDTFEVIGAGQKPTQAVFEKIKLRHQGRYPFLESLEHADNKVLQGADNAKDIAIIWNDFDPKAKNVTLFIAGLSNETAAIDHPIEKDADGNPVKVYLRKTLALNYSIGGDKSLRTKAQLTYTDKQWVMR